MPTKQPKENSVEEIVKEFEERLRNTDPKCLWESGTVDCPFEDIEPILKDTIKQVREETLQAVIDLIEHRTTKCACCNDFEKRLKSLEMKTMTKGTKIELDPTTVWVSKKAIREMIEGRKRMTDYKSWNREDGWTCGSCHAYEGETHHPDCGNIFNKHLNQALDDVLSDPLLREHE